VVPYTTSYPERWRTTGLIAACAIALSILAGGLVNGSIISITDRLPGLSIIIGPVAPMALFGIFYKLYDRWLWHLPVLGTSIPNLAGTWNGQVTFHEPADGPPLQCRVVIKQSWTKLSIAFTGTDAQGTPVTQSSVIMAGLNSFDNVNGGLRYEYEVVPLGQAVAQPRAVGMAHLTMLTGDSHLGGEYFNLPQNLGPDVGWFHRHGAYSLTRA